MIVLLLGLIPALNAQEAGTVTVKLNKADLKGQALDLDLDIRINHIYIGKRESLSLTLALQKGNNIVHLPPVIINGTNKRKMYERAVNLYGLKEAMGDAYAVLKNDEDLIQFLPYKKAIAYKPWMNRSQLILIGEILDYNNNVTQTFTDVLEKSLIVSSPNKKNSVRPTEATPKPRVQQKSQEDEWEEIIIPSQQPQQQQPLIFQQGEYPNRQQRAGQQQFRENTTRR